MQSLFWNKCKLPRPNDPNSLSSETDSDLDLHCDDLLTFLKDFTALFASSNEHFLPLNRGVDITEWIQDFSSPVSLKHSDGIVVFVVDREPQAYSFKYKRGLIALQHHLNRYLNSDILYRMLPLYTFLCLVERENSNPLFILYETEPQLAYSIVWKDFAIYKSQLATGFDLPFSLQSARPTNLRIKATYLKDDLVVRYENADELAKSEKPTLELAYIEAMNESLDKFEYTDCYVKDLISIDCEPLNLNEYSFDSDLSTLDFWTEIIRTIGISERGNNGKCAKYLKEYFSAKQIDFDHKKVNTLDKLNISNIKNAYGWIMFDKSHLAYVPPVRDQHRLDLRFGSQCVFSEIMNKLIDFEQLLSVIDKWKSLETDHFAEFDDSAKLDLKVYFPDIVFGEWFADKARESVFYEARKFLKINLSPMVTFVERNDPVQVPVCKISKRDYEILSSYPKGSVMGLLQGQFWLFEKGVDPVVISPDISSPIAIRLADKEIIYVGESITIGPCGYGLEKHSQTCVIGKPNVHEHAYKRFSKTTFSDVAILKMCAY